MAIVSGAKSVLNPDAPLFIPAAFREVEDFSPEWWKLIKTSTWFQDFWLNQHPEEKFDGDMVDDDDDLIEDLLINPFDINLDEEFLNAEDQFEGWAQSSQVDVYCESSFFAPKKEIPQNGYGNTGLEMDVKAIMENLSVEKSSKEKGPKFLVEPVKYREKAAQYVSPKCSPRRIHQPR